MLKRYTFNSSLRLGMTGYKWVSIIITMTSFCIGSITCSNGAPLVSVQLVYMGVQVMWCVVGRVVM